MAIEARERNEPIDPNDLIKGVEYALILLGNANAACLYERQKIVLRALNPKLECFAERSTEEPSSTELFGPKLRKDIKNHVELSKEVSAFERSLGSQSAKPKWTQPSRSFTRGQPNRFSPYQTRGGGFRGKGPNYSRGDFRKRNNFTGDVDNSISKSNIMAGRLSSCFDEWQTITNDSWVLEVIKGYKLPFITYPNKYLNPAPHAIPKSNIEIVKDEVNKLLAKGAIEKVTNTYFLNQIFLVPKKDAAWRPILNLKPLNKLLEIPHFKMEKISMIQDFLTKGMWMAKIDLEDAYFSVSINSSDRKFLQFLWNGTVYQYTCLPFGLATAPFVFTKITKPIVQHMRFWGMKVILYLDDLFIANDSEIQLKNELTYATSLLERLGFKINHKKSVLIPTQNIQFLGFEINSNQMCFNVPQEKKQKIVDFCINILKVVFTTPRSLAKLLGMITSITLAFNTAYLHIRYLQSQLIQELQAQKSWESKIRLNQNSRLEIAYWIENLPVHPGSPVLLQNPDMVIESDSSLEGWGSRCNHATTGGLWSKEDKIRCGHINSLELKAAMLALQSFAKNQNDIHVRLKLDNKTAVAYVNHLGGTRSMNLNKIALELWEWCLERGIWITAEYLPGKSNLWADWESRNSYDASDWKLKPSVFTKLQRKFRVEVDLFASRTNYQLHQYVSWRADPQSIAVDALKIDWSTFKGYAFPPFNLIGKCLRKCQVDQAKLLLVAPMWRNQPWYPTLLKMLYQTPILLPLEMDLLLNPNGDPHPLIISGALTLLAWPITGKLAEQVHYQSGLNSCSGIPFGNPLPGHIRVPSAASLAGVSNDKLIPIAQL